jgi:hypothetical protein
MNAEQKRIATTLGLLGLAMLGFGIAAAKTKSRRPGAAYYKPGQQVHTSPGAQFILRLPAGRYDLVGADGGAPGVQIVAVSDRGKYTDLVLAVLPTTIQFEGTPTFCNIDDPSECFNVHLWVKPQGGA